MHSKRMHLRLFLCARALPGAEAGPRKQKGTPIDAFRRDWRPAEADFTLAESVFAADLKAKARK